MEAPVSITHTHVHSMRLRSGAEALVARVLAADGTPGFGFTLNLEAAPARDMAEWDAAARSRKVPLYALFGGKQRERVEIEREGGHARTRIDPFALGSLEAVRSVASYKELVLVAPHEHPWEIAYCAALAATLAGDVRIAVRVEPAQGSIRVSESPGIDIDWSVEPAFSTVGWYPAEEK
jgi:L-alanine-DL-glutamate epimerase-like enolase superfamily enzyme